LIDLAHKRRRIVVYLKRLQVLIDAFKSRVSTDSGTFEGESNLKKMLQFIQNLFTSLVVLTPNAWKVSKLYTILQNDGTTDFDFVRNTAATRVNESGLIETVGNNIPRIDWLNGKPQINIEGQSTNLVFRNIDLNNSAWNKTRLSITSNSTISPDGTMNGDKLVENTDNNFRGIVQLSKTITAGSDVFLSCFVKRSERFRFRISAQSTLGWTTRPFTEINLNTLTVTSGNATIIPFPNDWYRIILLGKSNTVTNTGFEFFLLSDSGVLSYQGDGVSGLFMWGAQFEEDNISSLIKTEGTSVTRNADIATLNPPTGTTEIIETVDGVDNSITTIPATYQLPIGRIDKVVMK
jgi:hypothetical protein